MSEVGGRKGNTPLAEDKNFIHKVKLEVIAILKKNHGFSEEEISDAIAKGLKGFNMLMWAAGASHSSELCAKCGICCKICHPIRLDVEDIPRISQYLHLSIGKFHIEYVSVEKDDEGEYFTLKRVVPCYFLRNNRCFIYVVRPLVCRFYPFNCGPEKIVFQEGCKIPVRMAAFTTTSLLVMSKIPLELRIAQEQFLKNLWDKQLEKYKSPERASIEYVKKWRRLVEQSCFGLRR